MSAKERATCWSVTINNPIPPDEENIALARQKGWKVDGQLEKGAQGTLHYQLCVKTPQVRFSAVKKAFPRAHIEVARNAPALAAYVGKSETAVAPLPSQSESYPSLSKFWELIYGCLDLVWGSHPRFPGKDCDRFREPMRAFDIMVSQLIAEGYHVESIACNPLTRSMWKLYHPAIIQRQRAVIVRQTDSQPDLISQSVVIPTIEDGLQTSSVVQAQAETRREEDDAPPSDSEAE